MGSDSSQSVGQCDKAVSLTIDSRQISRDAALRAAYWFTQHLNVEFPASNAEHTFEVVLRPKAPTLDNPVTRPLRDLVDEFQNSLIDFELRVRVQNETAAIRELILAKAFAEAGVLEDPPVGSFNDPVLSGEDELHSKLVNISEKGST
jgi:His-Xaa-Ser system protein HxsD